MLIENVTFTEYEKDQGSLSPWKCRTVKKGQDVKEKAGHLHWWSRRNYVIHVKQRMWIQI